MCADSAYSYTCMKCRVAFKGVEADFSSLARIAPGPCLEDLERGDHWGYRCLGCGATFCGKCRGGICPSCNGRRFVPFCLLFEDGVVSEEATHFDLGAVRLAVSPSGRVMRIRPTGAGSYKSVRRAYQPGGKMNLWSVLGLVVTGLAVIAVSVPVLCMLMYIFLEGASSLARIFSSGPSLGFLNGLFSVVYLVAWGIGWTVFCGAVVLVGLLDASLIQFGAWMSKTRDELWVIATGLLASVVTLVMCVIIFHHATGRVPWLGWVIVGLIFIGDLVMAVDITDMPFCETCHRYMTRYALPAVSLQYEDAVLRRLGEADFAGFAEIPKSSQTTNVCKLQVWKCKQCARAIVEVKAERGGTSGRAIQPIVFSKLFEDADVSPLIESVRPSAPLFFRRGISE